MCAMKNSRSRYGSTLLLLAVTIVGPAFPQAQRPSVEKIVANSVLANQRDFQAAVHYNWKERERTPKGSKLSQVTMIDGTPYYRLIAVNGKPLSPAEQAKAKKKEQQAA